MSQLCLRWEQRRSKFRPADPIRTAESRRAHAVDDRRFPAAVALAAVAALVRNPHVGGNVWSAARNRNDVVERERFARYRSAAQVTHAAVSLEDREPIDLLGGDSALSSSPSRGAVGVEPRGAFRVPIDIRLGLTPEMPLYGAATLVAETVARLVREQFQLPRRP